MCDTTTAATLGSTSRPSEEQFVLGDDDDLPGYSAVGSRPPSVFSVDARSRDLGGGTSKSAPSETRVHYIRADDSLNSVALAYRISVRQDAALSLLTTKPRALAALNSLPPACLTTSPHLLHTRPFLILPAGVQSLSAEPLLDEESERRRLLVRRFQIETKATDERVARLYLDMVHELRDKVEGGRRGGELEEAVENYNTDLRYEQSQSSAVRGRFTGSRVTTIGEGAFRRGVHVQPAVRSKA